MALDIYDSQYLVILAPSLVIALIFLFFWLFMKETSYDEVLARQKRDLKLPPSKPDTRKKNDKKKSKKKESSRAPSRYTHTHTPDQTLLLQSPTTFLMIPTASAKDILHMSDCGISPRLPPFFNGNL
uniref:Ribosome receptor lysine/proline rich domain-containing protein n=1 Tax=Oncorhynchus mykiss TaxID=8022 RepID=A0A8K9WMG3_ONCMY